MLLEHRSAYLWEKKSYTLLTKTTAPVSLPVSCPRNLCSIPHNAFQTFPAPQQYSDQRLNSFSSYGYKRLAEWRRLALPWSLLPPKRRSILQLFCRYYTVLQISSKKSTCAREHENKELTDICKGFTLSFQTAASVPSATRYLPISHSHDEKYLGLKC